MANRRQARLTERASCRLIHAGPIIGPFVPDPHEWIRPATARRQRQPRPRSAAGDRGLRAVRAGRRRAVRRAEGAAPRPSPPRSSGSSREAILHRDTPGDVGTAIKTPAELVARGRRARRHRRGQAAGRGAADDRGVSEDDRSRRGASKVESIRYRFYDIEQRIALTLRPAACDFADVRLYVLITESLCKRPWLEAAEAGDPRRRRLPPAPREDRSKSANCSAARSSSSRSAASTTSSASSTTAPTSRCSAGADGVHVGQTDLPAARGPQAASARARSSASARTTSNRRSRPCSTAPTTSASARSSAARPSRATSSPARTTRGRSREQIQIPAVAIAGITEAECR